MPIFIRRLAFAGLHLYWRLARPVVLGSRILVVKDGEVLLVRMTYTPGWQLPGGGVDKRESFQTAALRELAEECGLRALNAKLFGLYFSRRFGKSDQVAVYMVENFEKIEGARPDPEIAEVRFHRPDQLPSDTTPATRRRVEEFLGIRPQTEHW